MKKTRLVAWAVAFAILIAGALGFGVLANRVLTGISGDVALAIVTLVSTTWLAIWSFYKTKQKEAEALIFPQKAAIYTELINIIRDLMFSTKGWLPPIDPNVLAERLARVRYDMIVWGGQDTIRAIERFEDSSASGDIGVMFVAVADLYGKIRRDLGHTDDDRLADDLFLAQISADDKEQVSEMLRAARRG